MTEEKDKLQGLRKFTLGVLGLAVILFLYFVIADRSTPFAGDARVQAFILRIAPEVSGRVEAVGVTDNQIVDAGTELFRIETTPYKLGVEQAEAVLEQAGQAVGASTASVAVSQARLDEVRAAEANVRAQSSRTLDLVKRGVYPKAREDDAVAAIDEARAATQSAEADLRRAQEQLGPGGAENPQIKEALAALERARFDLSRTTVVAPARGVVTNLQLAGGQTVSSGQPALTFISAQDAWLLAPLPENSIGVIAAGQEAEVVLDVLPGQVFPAVVRTIGWGVAEGQTNTSTGLPVTPRETGWLADAQRFPVQLSFDHENPPKGARYGSRAAVIIYTGGNPVMNAIAWIRIRLIAFLTYVS